MSEWKPGASIEMMHHRSEFINKIRAFFQKRNLLEVETPALSQFPAIDLHLESFSIQSGNARRYLMTSPEYHMKRLIAAGSGSIFQICKAFRCDEAGERHNPEFTILEWYRVEWDYRMLMKEIDELLQELLNTRPADYLPYCEAFVKHLGVNPLDITHAEFKSTCDQHNLTPPEFLMNDDIHRDEWLNYLMGMVIEPILGKDKPVFILDYPATQANLARLKEDNPRLSKRFEVYFKGLELGNGFDELTDPIAQQRRFEEENQKRVLAGKAELPIDDNFIAALKSGMPQCSGVAMGLDRLLMLAHSKGSIEDVVSFTWNKS